MEKRPVPGFEGRYEIDAQGSVYNIKGHPIKPVRTPYGDVVDLCAYGQRELLLINDILKEVFDIAPGKGC
jgi:hypothetical protein